jgi:hypothetical protein
MSKYISNAILNALSQSLTPKSDFFLRRLKSNNKNTEKTKAPKIALILMAHLENPRNILINSKPINPSKDINRNNAKEELSENE